VLLYETLIRNHLKAGQACFDPFVGSGTCLAEAEVGDERLGGR
jgi:DNA modification methylase